MAILEFLWKAIRQATKNPRYLTILLSVLAGVAASVASNLYVHFVLMPMTVISARGFVVSDERGYHRVRIGVDSDGAPEINFLDSGGHTAAMMGATSEGGAYVNL